MKKRLLAVSAVVVTLVLLGVTLSANFFSERSGVFAAEREDAAVDAQITDAIEGIINWKKGELGVTPDESLISRAFLQLAGSTAGDWYPIGLGRYCYSDDFDAYLAVVSDYVSKKYGEPGKLHAVKATEWHRIALAVAAAGGNPAAVGSDNGRSIDLIADGTYDRGKTASPGRQGINGWIWGLIALDSGRYEVPENAFHTRQDFIVNILKDQLADGGFALSGAKSDPDVTAMAVQALAPYYNSETVYEYASAKVKNTDGAFEQREKAVREVVDESLTKLSAAQNADGDYASWGMPNAESTCQVIVALAALGIDALSDPRFTKGGNTLLDGLMKYRLENGGFLHSYTYDPDNPTALPGEANSMAGEQALYTLVALWRQRGGMRALYDMREEFSVAERAAIDASTQAIAALADGSTKAEAEAAYSLYQAVGELDRCYVAGYWKLSALLKRQEIEVPEEEPDYGGNDSGAEQVLTYFTASDIAAVHALPPPENLNTGYYTEVVTLKAKLENAENREENTPCLVILDTAYRRISGIQAETDAINTEILDKLHPFDHIGLGDKAVIDALAARYNALNDYDKGQIAHYEELLKSKTQVDNLLTALIVGVSCGVAALALAVFVLLHIRARKKKKLAQKMRESEE